MPQIKLRPVCSVQNGRFISYNRDLFYEMITVSTKKTYRQPAPCAERSPLKTSRTDCWKFLLCRNATSEGSPAEGSAAPSGCPEKESGEIRECLGKYKNQRCPRESTLCWGFARALTGPLSQSSHLREIDPNPSKNSRKTIEING